MIQKPIDFFAQLDLLSVDDRDNNFAALPNQIIHMRGTKTIGTDASDNLIYKFDLDLVTNASGTLSIEELEWDVYTISLPSDTTKDVAGTNPLSPFSVLPLQDIDLSVALANQSSNSLLGIFLDQAQTPVASVSATLSDSLSFEETILSGQPQDPDFGQSFFKNLTSGTYDLVATASGFLDTSLQTTVNGYTTETVILNPE